MTTEKLFYRVGDSHKKAGLWYSWDGKFTGKIHSEFKFCAASNLSMPFDENLVGMLSCTESLEQLAEWFPAEDVARLSEFGYQVLEYAATDYRKHANHYVINQQTSRITNVLTDEYIKNLTNSKRSR